MRTNWQSCIIAFLMACSLWYTVAGREPLEAWTTAQVVLSAMPDDMVILDGMQPSIEVRVRAPKALLRSLSEQPVAYPLDLSGLHVGLNTIPILTEDFRLGGAFEVTEVRPPRLHLTVDTLIERDMAVSIQKRLPHDIVATVKSVSPETVRVRGPKKLINALDVIPAKVTVSKAFSRSGPVNEVLTVPVKLDLPDGVEIVSAIPDEFVATIAFTQLTRTISVYREVTVSEANGANVKVRPEKVRLFLQMPASERLKKNRSKEVRAEVVVPDSLLAQAIEVDGEKKGASAAKRQRAKLTFRVYLPEGVWLQRAEPEQVQVTITP